jgi:acyl-CoA synthetase (AMP-forming)/AMP-acid ligase II
MIHADLLGGRARLTPDKTALVCVPQGTRFTFDERARRLAVVPQRMMSWNAYNTMLCRQPREDDVSPVFTPLYHAGGLGAFLTPMVAIGGTIVLHAGFDVSEIWQTIERERCTVVLGVPTIYRLMMDAPEFEHVDLSHIRLLISGGAPLPLYIIDAYQRRGGVVKQGYGLTEVGVNCFAMTVEESALKQGSIGKPLMSPRRSWPPMTGARSQRVKLASCCRIPRSETRPSWAFRMRRGARWEPRSSCCARNGRCRQMIWARSWP